MRCSKMRLNSATKQMNILFKIFAKKSFDEKF